MKIVCVSDIHLRWNNPRSRLDNIVETQFNKLRYVWDYCIEKDITYILQAGDLFDVPRSWHLLSKMNEFFGEYGLSAKKAPNLLSVYGQHDIYFRSDTAKSTTMMGVLEDTGQINICGDEPWHIDDNVFVYGASWDEPIPKIDHWERSNDCIILLIHAPISDRSIYPGMVYTEASDFLDQHPEFDLIICADIHRKFIAKSKNRILVNCGPMIRAEATEYNFSHKPCFYVYDTEERKGHFEEIPHERAERILTREHIEFEQSRSEMLADFIQSIKDTAEGVEKDGDVSFHDNLSKVIKDNNISKDIVDIIEEVINK